MPKPRDIPRELDMIGQITKLTKPQTKTEDGWIKVGDASEEISPAWQNGWGNLSSLTPVSFFLSPDGMVTIRGQATGGADGTVAFTLPVGFRPEFMMEFLIPGGGEDGVGRITIDSNGDVTFLTSGSSVTDTSSVHSGDAAGGALTGTYPNPDLNASVAGNGLAISSNVLSVGVDNSTIEINSDQLRVKAGGIASSHIASTIDTNARIGVRKNSTGSTFLRRRVNLIEGSNITLTVADDSTDEEVDITIASSGGGGGSVATDTIWDAKGDLAAGTGADTAAKLTVGSNNKVLSADSTQTTGLAWVDIDGGGA